MVHAGYPRASKRPPSAVLKRGVRGSVVRLPHSVRGDGDYGFVPFLINFARDKSVSAYVGDGLNCWPAVHRLDAAAVYRRALEKSAAVARYRAVADEAIPLRAIASMIGHRLKLPVVSKTLEQAKDHFDWSTQFVAGGVPASSRWTRERLAWQPRQPGLLADIDQPDYFAAGVAPVV